MEFKNIKHHENTQATFDIPTCGNIHTFFEFSSFSQTCTIISIKNDLESLNATDVVKIFEKIGQRCFVLLLRSIKNDSFAFYWRVEDTNRVLCLESEVNEELSLFIKDFLVTAVEKTSNGKK